MAKGLAAFAVGLGSGYLTAQQRGRDQERQDRQDAQNSELHGLRMDEANAAKNLRMGLADAVAPREVNAGSVLDGGQTKEFYKDPAQVTPQMQEDRRIESEMRAEVPGAAPAGLAVGQATPGYGTTGKMGLGNQITTEKPDAAALNNPAAQAQRIGMAYGAAGKPLEAMQYQKSVDDMEAARKKRFSELQREGALRTATAMLSGDAENVFRTYNAQGDKKLKEVPTVKVVPRDLPGFGIVQDKIYSGILVDKDGNEKPLTMGSHDANMALYDYKDMMEIQSKGLSRVDDAKYKAGMLGAAQTNADSRRITAEATKTRAERPAGGGLSGGVSNAGAKLQSKTTDGDGYLVGVFRDGSTKRLTDSDGNPIKAESYEKRVDSAAQHLIKNSRKHARMTYEEVRSDVEAAMMLGKNPAGQAPKPAQPAPGLANQNTSSKPAASSPASTKPNYSNLWK